MRQRTDLAYRVFASVIGGALFVPIDSVPWWTALLPQLPSWLWPFLGGAAVYIAYDLGYRTNAAAWRVHSLEAAPAEPTGAATISPAPEAPALQLPLDSDLAEVIQTALSLRDASAAEAERAAGTHTGREITVTGVTRQVEEYHGRISMMVSPPETNCNCFLELPLALAPVLKAMAPGLPVKARGTISTVGYSIGGSVYMKDCELLRIGI